MAKEKTGNTIVFSPFTRVEGDLRLEVSIEDSRVAGARASGTLFRGFEEMVAGRKPTDAIVFLCRICGQCGAAHSAASAAALADACGVEPAPNGILCRSIMQAVETILSHLAHFYFSFAGDMCALPEGAALTGRFEAIKGTSFRRALRARRVLLGVLGLFAGKWPNSLAMQPGGVTRALHRSELTRAKGILAEFIRSFEEDLLGCRLGDWLGHETREDVRRWAGPGAHAGSDMAVFVTTALEAGLDKVGGGPGRFLSSGGFALPGGGKWLNDGYFDGQTLHPLDPAVITEDVTYSWYETEPTSAHPAEAIATSTPDKESAYSWGKAPRYGGTPVEVGPMARLFIGGDRLAESILADGGPSVFARELLRLHEIVLLADVLPKWIDAIDPDETFCVPCEIPETGSGWAITEAPRGTLGHWVNLERSRIRNYQVITPTGWNLSPRDEEDKPGPLEEALLGTPVGDGDSIARVVLVVGSYDPCLYCSVH